MTISVGRIEIDDDRKLILPDLKSRDVVEDLREQAERDATQSHPSAGFWLVQRRAKTRTAS